MQTRYGSCETLDIGQRPAVPKWHKAYERRSRLSNAAHDVRATTGAGPVCACPVLVLALVQCHLRLS